MRREAIHHERAVADSAGQLVQVLRAAGLVPQRRSAEFERQLREDGGRDFQQRQPVNLLTRLEAAWQVELAEDATGVQQRLAIGRLAWLRREREAGTWLTLGPPVRCSESNRLWWWRTDSAGQGKRVAVVSSRVGRPHRRLAPWLVAIRGACEQVAATGERLISAPGTTTDRWLARCAQRLGVGRIRLIVSDRPPRAAASWLRQRMRTAARPPDAPADWPPDAPADWPANAPSDWHISPPCFEVLPESAASPPVDDWPARDAALLDGAQRLIVLRLRRGGHWWSLLRAWSGGDPRHRAEVQMAVGEGLVAGEMARELADWGVQLWQPAESSARLAGELRSRTRSQAATTTRIGPTTEAVRPLEIRSDDPPRIVALPDDATEWLTHCTRRRVGPWPDQSEAEYLDEWLLWPEEVKDSAEDALRRIVRQRRLIASSRGIRGAYRVVAFTAVAPRQLEALHRFRPHRGRWDFEPYGLAIRRAWLIDRGTRPVIYGDEKDWRRLALDDRPFFQRRLSSGRGGDVAMDWSVEREWRCLGDLDLGELRDDQAMILVPSRQVAVRFSSSGGWPVAALEENPD